MNRAVFYLILIVLQLLLAEVLLQVYYRITAGDWLTTRVGLPIFEHDDVRGYRVKPGLAFRHATNEFDVMYHTDSSGFRSNAQHAGPVPQKAANTFRVVLTGPSFAFGIAGEYEDIYARLFETGLQVHGKTVEVVNIGTPGQPPDRQMCWIEQIAPQYQPDMVIQTIYGEIDLVGTKCELPEGGSIIENGYILRERPSLFRRITIEVKRSALVFYTWYVYQQIMGGKPTEGLGLDLYEDRMADGEAATVTSIVDSAALKFAMNQELIRNALGADTLIAYVYFPYSFIVRPEDISRWSHLDEKKRDPAYQRHLADSLTRKLQDDGLVFINTTNALIAADSQDRTYNFLDIHFTRAGNRAVAESALPVLNSLVQSR